MLFSNQVTSDSLCPLGLQHTRLPSHLSLSPGVCSNSCPSSWWCHPTISSSDALFSCLQSFPASGSFPINWLFASGWQSIGASASASFLPMNSQGWFPLGLSGLISLLSKGISRVFSNTTFQKNPFFSFSSILTSVRDCWKTIAVTVWTFVSKVLSLLFNALSRFVTAFLSRSKHLLISWLQSPSAVILERKK